MHFEDELFELFLLNSGISKSKIDECRPLVGSAAGGSLGEVLLKRGYITASKLAILLKLHAKDMEDKLAPAWHPVQEELLKTIVNMKQLSSQGDVAGCEKLLAVFEAIEPYIQLAKVLTLKAQTSRELATN
ncbi:MAG: hypothetical protein NUW37_14320 [Planctomycetes bacterium]|nr:hypothetical protein [Planctomycetota bacterium]